jgi:hypothetical protein
VLNVYSSPAEVEGKIGLPDYRYDRPSADSNGPGQLIEYFYLAYTPDNTMKAVVRGKPLRDGFRFGAVEPLKGLADAFLVSHAMKLYSFAFSNGALYQACIDWLGVKVSRDFVWYLSPPGEGYNSDGTPMLPKDVSLWELSPVSRLAQQQTLFCQ